MTVPSVIARQEEEAERLLDELEKDAGNTDDKAHGEDGEDIQNTDDEKEESALDKKEDELSNKEAGDDDVKSEKEDVGEVEELRAKLIAMEDKYVPLKQAHEVLKGKYSAEVPTLSAEIRQLKQELEAVKAKALESGKESSGNKDLNAFKEKFAESYGDEAANDIVGLIQSMVGSSTSGDAYKSKIEALESQVTQLKEAKATEGKTNFIKTLDESVKNWRDIRDSNEFSEYMSQVDEATGYTRLDLAKHANSSGDAERVAYWYKAFLRTPAGKRFIPTSGKPSKEGILHPTTQGGAKHISPSQKTFTPQEIDTFYKRKNSGYYKNNPDDANRLEDAIDKYLDTIGS